MPSGTNLSPSRNVLTESPESPPASKKAVYGPSGNVSRPLIFKRDVEGHAEERKRIGPRHDLKAVRHRRAFGLLFREYEVPVNPFHLYSAWERDHVVGPPREKRFFDEEHVLPQRDKPGREPAEQAGNDPEPDLCLESRERPDHDPKPLPFRLHYPRPLQESLRLTIEHGVDRRDVAPEGKGPSP